MTTERSKHDGELWLALISDSEAEVEYLGEQVSKRHNAVCYRYRCAGAHQGIAVEVLMVNPHLEHDGEEFGGYYPDYDALAWADDESPFDQLLEDLYSDALREDLSEIARGWE